MEERAHQLLMALEDAGFEAYVVGGAVRDLLMGRTPHDYDIATSARPDDIRRVAEEKGWHTAEINAEALASSSSSSRDNPLKLLLFAVNLTVLTATGRNRFGMPIPFAKTCCAAILPSTPWPWTEAVRFTTMSAAERI